MNPSGRPAHNPRLVRVIAIYFSVLHFLAMFGVAALVVVAALQVFFRYALGDSLYWSEELMRSIMVWIAFLAAGIAYSRGEMLGMHSAVDALPERFARRVDAVGRALTVIFLLVVTWYGLQFTLRTSEQEAVSLEISLGWLHAAIPVGCFLLALHVAFTGLFRSALPNEEAPHQL